MKSMIVLAALLLAVPATALAQRYASNADAAHVHYAWANVTRVDPVYHMQPVPNPHQQCQQVPVAHQGGGGHTAATVLGAVVGGVLGSTVGKGDGRTAATVAGAVAGGVVGNQVAGRNDGAAGQTVTRCRQVVSTSQERRIVGYNVEYRYRGSVYMSRLDYDPGERLRVRISVTPAD